jgi:hypothetical protein
MYRPRSSVTTIRLTLVWVWVTVTLAAESAPPTESTIVPDRSADVGRVWA